MSSFVFDKAVWTLSEYQGGRPPKMFVFKMPVSSFFCSGHDEADTLTLPAVFGEFVNYVELKMSYRSTRTAPTGEKSVVYSVAVSCVGGIDMFLKLKNQFGDKVKLTASLTSSTNRMEFLSSTEQMTIGDNYTCKGVLSPMSFRDVEILEKAALSGEGRLKMITIQFHFLELEWDAPLMATTPPAELEGSNSKAANADSKIEALEKVRQLNEKILQEGLCTDVIVTCKDGTKFNSHRSFLSAASPVFQAMFKNKMKESLTAQLDLPTLSEKAVQAFVSFLYTRDMIEHVVDSEVAFELLRTGHQYEIPELITSMMMWLQKANEDGMGVKLAYEIYTFVKNLDGASSLKEKAIKVLKRNWKEFKASPECKEFFENKEAIIELCGDLAEY